MIAHDAQKVVLEIGWFLRERIVFMNTREVTATTQHPGQALLVFKNIVRGNGNPEVIPSLIEHNNCFKRLFGSDLRVPPLLAVEVDCIVEQLHHYAETYVVQESGENCEPEVRNFRCFVVGGFRLRFYEI